MGVGPKGKGKVMKGDKTSSKKLTWGSSKALTKKHCFEHENATINSTVVHANYSVLQWAPFHVFGRSSLISFLSTLAPYHKLSSMNFPNHAWFTTTQYQNYNIQWYYYYKSWMISYSVSGLLPTLMPFLVHCVLFFVWNNCFPFYKSIIAFVFEKKI